MNKTMLLGITVIYFKDQSKNIYAELPPDKEKLDFQMYPRLEACAEQGWCKNKTSYNDFLKRLKSFYAILDSNNIFYARDCVVKAPLYQKEKWRKIWYSKDTQVEIDYQKKQMNKQ